MHALRGYVYFSGDDQSAILIFYSTIKLCDLEYKLIKFKCNLKMIRYIVLLIFLQIKVEKGKNVPYTCREN